MAEKRRSGSRHRAARDNQVQRGGKVAGHVRRAFQKCAHLLERTALRLLVPEPGQHQHAQRPQVSGAVHLAFKHFRRQAAGCSRGGTAQQRVRHLPRVAYGKHVVRMEMSVDKVLAVEILQRFGHGRRRRQHLFGLRALRFAQLLHQEGFPFTRAARHLPDCQHRKHRRMLQAQGALQVVQRRNLVHEADGHLAGNLPPLDLVGGVDAFRDAREQTVPPVDEDVFETLAGEREDQLRLGDLMNPGGWRRWPCRGRSIR